jgi:hypothetical protein
MPVAPPSQEVQDAVLASGTIVTRRVEVYESDAETLWTGISDTSRLIEGSVTVDYSREERRALDLTLDNTDSAFNQDPNGGFWYDKVIKCYRGVITPNESYEAQLGEFVIDRIDNQSFPHTTKVTARDYTKKCLTSKFITATSYAPGSFVDELIRDIAANAGITKFNLPVTGIVIGKTFSFDKGSTRWEAIKSIADAYGYELYFDPTGYLTMRLYQDPIISPIKYRFSTGLKGNLITYSKSSDDSQIYNHVVVTGGSSDGSVPPVFAEALNTEPSSPTRIERIGDRLYEFDSSFITTVQQAQDVADKFLKIHALENFDLNLESIVLPWLEVGDIVGFVDPNPAINDPDTFLLQTFSIPLTLTSMGATAGRITIVGAAGAALAGG